MFRRRALVHAGLIAPLLGASSGRAAPLEQPRLVYGFAAGSAGDLGVRRIAERMGASSYARSAPLVENRPGGGGRLAMDLVRQAPRDGSVLVFTPYACSAVYPHVYPQLGYDPTRDFAPVALAAVMQHGLAVGPLVPAAVTDLRGFLAWARANPERAGFASPGPGTTPHLVGALLGLVQGVELRHQAGRGVADVVAGALAAVLAPVGDLLAAHRAGSLRLLAGTGRARQAFAPELPTFAEQGFGELTVEEWFGFFAPARTPAAVVQAANAAVNHALRDRGVIDALAGLGLLARGSTIEEMAQSQRAELERWGPLVRRVGFTAQG